MNAAEKLDVRYDDLCLADLGERAILKEIIPRYSASSGDDCEAIACPAGDLLLTTDPVPPPAAASIGGSDDPYWAGWLLVIINASDVAAAAADPMALMVAAEFPPEETVARFKRFLEGVRDACDAEGFRYAGGNLREAQRFSATATAVGWRPAMRGLRRQGAEAGDLIVSVGQGGVFWRDAFRLMRGRSVRPEDSPVFRPRSQGATMRALAREGLLSAAMDNSDGLLPTVAELGRLNGLSAHLDVRALAVPGLEGDDDVAAARLWLGWGDWTVLATVTAERFEQAARTAREAGGVLVPIGRMELGNGEVRLDDGEYSAIAGRLDSERFVRDSWFSAGIGAYASALRAFSLPGDA